MATARRGLQAQQLSWEGFHMDKLRNVLRRRNEDGASAVEYGLLVAGIAALIVAVVFLFGNMIGGVFKSTCNNVASNVNGNNGSVSTC
jgi:pilus assembly protein Flp/PilA